jgi:hypothetical protein
MNRKVFVIAVLLVLSSLILSLVPVFPQLTETHGYPSSQTHYVSDNPAPKDDATSLQSKSQETTKNGMCLEQSDSPLSQDRGENKVGTVNEPPQTPLEGIIEKTENQTLPVRLDAVLPPSEFEPIHFAQP